MHAAARKKQGSGEGTIVTFHWINVWEHVLPMTISGPVEPVKKTLILQGVELFTLLPTYV